MKTVAAPDRAAADRRPPVEQEAEAGREEHAPARRETPRHKDAAVAQQVGRDM